MICYIRNIFKHNNPARNNEINLVQNKNSSIGFDAIFDINGYPTFKEMFLLINKLFDDKKVPNDAIFVLANQDIEFTEKSLSQIKLLAKTESALCLATYDFCANQWKLRNRPDSQDCWVFKGRIRVPKFCEFKMGMLGCDNRLMYELDKIGYKISNPAKSIETHHRHSLPNKYGPKVDKPYKLLFPHI